MNKLLAMCAACAVATFPLQADAGGSDVFDNPGVMVGLAFKFGGASPSTKDVGVTAKILSNRNEETFVLGAGVTVYPMDPKSFGLDISAGYNFDNVTVMGGFDVLQRMPQVSIGWSNTDDTSAITPIDNCGDECPN
jgi:hypothetical protein